MSCPACGAHRSGPSSAGSGEFEGFVFDYRRCCVCESIYVAPMPDEALLAAMYSPRYLQQNYLEGAVEAEELGQAVSLIASRWPRARVLDVGSGAGEFVSLAAERGLAVEGHELSPDSAQRLSQRVGLPIYSGSLSDLRERFDVVHVADVLEHVPEPRKFLVNLRQLLRARGVIVARGPLEAQPTLFDLSMRARRSLRRRLGAPTVHRLPPWHVSLFTLKGWRRLAEGASLEVVDQHIRETSWPVGPTEHSLRAYVRKVSIAASHSTIGRALHLGNRVVSVWQELQRG